MKPPRLIFQGFGGQELGFRAFHVVEDEKQRLRRQPRKELDRVRTERRRLGVVRRRDARIPEQVRPQALRVGGVRHVLEGGLQHPVLRVHLFRQLNGAERRDAEEGRNVRLRRTAVQTGSVRIVRRRRGDRCGWVAAGAARGWMSQMWMLLLNQRRAVRIHHVLRKQT